MQMWLYFKLLHLKYTPDVTCVVIYHPIYRMGCKFLPCLLHKVKTECDHTLKNVNSYCLIIIIIFTRRVFQEPYGIR